MPRILTAQEYKEAKENLDMKFRDEVSRQIQNIGPREMADILFHGQEVKVELKFKVPVPVKKTE